MIKPIEVNEKEAVDKVIENQQNKEDLSKKTVWQKIIDQQVVGGLSLV